jgi:hypothetical protein
MHPDDIIPTFPTSNIFLGLRLPKSLTPTDLWSYKMFEVMLIVRINNSMADRRILNFPMLRDTVAYHLARGILFKEGVP